MNLLDIDRWARDLILGAGAESCYVDYAPAFGRGPFGHWICTAVNDAVLHGMPYDRVLADPDGWTLRSATGCRTAHAEHTVAITPTGPEILPLPPARGGRN